ncbi:MAG: DEAD/DEAH box helicase family protein [Oscillatoriales cyanobacterium SM2_3_0]|nr:DEAD/DEAH box helicase family protein [Oscillatoriales cyanobacterium SM2_3_0]
MASFSNAGKTIETGLILRYLLVSQKVKRVLVLVPASVQPQWQEELREKFNLHFWSYAQGQFRDPYGQTRIASENPWNTCDLILSSSHLVRRKSRAQELLEAEPWDLIVLDEAHHARRKSPQNHKDTPNSLLVLMQQLKTKTRSLVLLSATPMQIDPIEVFDLLNLLGLEGHWAYSDNFCDYFASLAQDPDAETLQFWQTLSTDYFKRGGQPCPRLQQVLEQQDKLLAYKLRDTWQRDVKLANPKQVAKHLPFINASRQYLTTNTPLKDLMFRHTRDTLRQYYQRGLLDRDIARREVQDNAITLEPEREIPLYQAVSDYVRHFYRLAQKEERKALGFLMTLYRKRLTSSFYAIRESLQRRLETLQEGQGSSLTTDDLRDLDDADDAIIEGLESYMEPVDPQEIQYLEDLLRQFENTGEDTKLSHFIHTLRQELTERESAIVFTQYTDTMDYLRENLQQLYGERVACYSGRGGELYRNGIWQVVPKESIKRQFRNGELELLLCTESASEGLNLQTCGVLVNYDMPWNPMRVEQRIGRLDRIGQIHPTVRIHNFYYDGTVEAKVYRKLRDRIDAFTHVVGNLQPILARVPTFIERAVMSADSDEENVLMSDFDTTLETPTLRPGLEEMTVMDVEADLLEIRQLLPTAPIRSDEIKQLFTQSKLLKQNGVQFKCLGAEVWQLTYKGRIHNVTFDPEQFDQQPSLRFMSFGDPLFDELVLACSTPSEQ